MQSPEISRIPFPNRFDGDMSGFLAGVLGWIRSEPVRWLMSNAPGGWHEPDPALYESDDPLSGIRALDSICDWRTHGTHWDTRNDRERQEIEDALLSGQTEDRVIAIAEQLGLRDHRPPSRGHATAMVSLGGARLAPLERTQWLAEHLPPCSEQATADHVVLLGSSRPVIARTEKNPGELDDPRVSAYADGAETEFDLMVRAGMHGRMAPQSDDVWVPALIPPHPPVMDEQASLSASSPWIWKTWDRSPSGALVHGVQAPSGRLDAERANTPESLEFVARGLRGVQHWERAPERGRAGGRAVNGLYLGEGESVVISTSAIYVPFQQIEAVRVLGHPYGCAVEVIGHPIDRNPATASIKHLRTATQYLQEIRSVFQAALRLVDVVDPAGARVG